MPARPDLSKLNDALAECRAANAMPRLWLRDDDAITPTHALDRLHELSEATGVAVHLAVVPRGATPALGAYVSATPNFIPMVHGFAHQSHAPEDEKKAEFGAHRPLPARMADARAGLARLSSVFGPSLVAAFVPPWNRTAPDMGDALADAGFVMLSTYGPRAAAQAAKGLVQINAHVDPIDWRGTRGLVDADLILERLCKTLHGRANGDSDPSEPLGILTHHLVHDAAIWDFCEWLLGVLLDQGATPWRADEGIPST